MSFVLKERPTHGDKILWCYHSSGSYSAKSGYNWLRIQSIPAMASEKIWNAIAKANVLPKIKIFGWRLCHEALSTGEKLKQARFGEGSCNHCNASMESALHAIKNCPKSRSILKLSGLADYIVDWDGNSYFDWLNFSFTKLNREGFDLLLTLLWNIWNRRNKWIHDSELQPEREVILKSWNLLGEFKQVTNPFGCLTDKTPPRRNRNWCKQSLGGIKINVDGVFCPVSQKAAVGIVARDSNGMVLGGTARHIDPPNMAESTEAYAFSQGVQLAVENGWSNVVIEGDAISVVNRLANRSLNKIQDLSTIGLLLNEAHSLLEANPSIKVHYVCRGANRVAHTLLDEPECIKHIVIIDAIGI